MKDIVIIGAGGHAKVVLDILLEINKVENNINILGFLDDKKQGNIYNISILGKISDLKKVIKNWKSINFIIAIGDNKLREEIYKKNQELKFMTLIHPSAVIGNYTSIGNGTIVKANTTIGIGTKIGKFCLINSNVSVEQDCIIEDFVHIYPNVSIYGNNIIKDRLEIKSNSCIGEGKKIKDNIEFGEVVS